MTDSELLRLLWSIDHHNMRVANAIARIESSSRADAASLARDLSEQCLSVASAEDIGLRYIKKAAKKRQ